MSSKFKVRGSRLRKIFLYCLLLTAYCSPGCSVPNLEKPDCGDARDAVKRFYSFHFADDMKFSPENLKRRQSFLTPEYFQSLQNLPTENDVFTDSTEFPRAFRIGGCRIVEPNKRASLDVLMFWRDETRTEQREINVEAVKQNDDWLIDKISGKN